MVKVFVTLRQSSSTGPIPPLLRTRHVQFFAARQRSCDSGHEIRISITDWPRCLTPTHTRLSPPRTAAMPAMIGDRLGQPRDWAVVTLWEITNLARANPGPHTLVCANLVHQWVTHHT